MPKNIVICCDGTDNKLTLNENTNVIHLFRCLGKGPDQVAYYSPGVGTIAPDNFGGKFKRMMYTIKDKVMAGSLEKNVRDAYIYLMNHYEEGDKVFLFGFSRGAYTVRMLAGLLRMFGLLHTGNENHLRYVIEIYSKENKSAARENDEGSVFELAGMFKKSFSREVKIEFMGIWDTVVAVGVFNYIAFPYTSKLDNVKKVRHALAIDERRKHYKHYPVNEGHKNLKEVFFAGVHSDVGGSYPEETSGLSKITLKWMIDELRNSGLRLDPDCVDRYVLGLKNKRGGKAYFPPDHKTPIHNSLTTLFIAGDFMPRFRFSKTKGLLGHMKIDFSLWPGRDVPEGATIHQSVWDKIDQTDYKPRNLKDRALYQLEK